MADDNPPEVETETPDDAVSGGVSRRSFLGTAVAAGAAAAILPSVGASSLAHAAVDPVVDRNLPTDGAGAGQFRFSRRREAAFQTRLDAARLARRAPLRSNPNNGDEAALPNRIGSFSKGLAHNQFGEVNLSAYDALLRAVTSGDPDDFDAIPSGAPNFASRNLFVNPQSGLAFDLEGNDAQQLEIPPAPAFSSAEEAGEIVENYWMALLRDVPFSAYDSNPLALAAAADLSALSDFRGPKVNGVVTPQTLFRENVPGVLDGPYPSQFFLMSVPFGAQSVEPRVRTAVPDLDYLTDETSWLNIQNGLLPTEVNVFDPQLRFIRNGRDISSFVHIDVLFQAYFNAALSCLQPPDLIDLARSGIAAPLNPGNPYASSQNQAGFGTFGGPYIAALVCEVATRALKAVWFQKWFVHRRLRPEAFAGAIHHSLVNGRNYPIHPDALDSSALSETFSRNGTFFLPQAFPEGSPVHPAYGAGHATVAGACVTVLKAVLDETTPIANPVQPTPDGLSVQPYTGSDVLTIGGELNKLAVNVSIGRNIAGVHWRTDGIQSMKLGEELVISILRDQRLLTNERFAGFTFTRFDGTSCTI